MAANAAYEPSLAVKLAHSIPRIGASTSGEVQTDSTPFITIDDPLGYISTLLGFPILLLVVGLISVILFQIVLCCRCICKKWKCCQVSDKSYKANYICFFVFIVIAIVADNMQYFGNTYLTLGVKEAMRGTLGISEVFVILDGIAVMIGGHGGDIDELIVAGHIGDEDLEYCNSSLGVNELFLNMQLSANILKNASVTLHEVMVEVPDKLSMASDNMELYAINQKDLVMYCFYGVILFNLILLIIAGAVRSKVFTQIMIALAEIIVFLLTIICCVEMVIVVKKYSLYYP